MRPASDPHRSLLTRKPAAPCASMSQSSVRPLALAERWARLTAMLDFPAPPLGLYTATEDISHSKRLSATSSRRRIHRPDCRHTDRFGPPTSGSVTVF